MMLGMQSIARSVSRVPVFALALVAACHRGQKPDAYGNFEADEVVVSAQTTGQLLWFSPTEGSQLRSGDAVALVDTMQLALERRQIMAQRDATGARANEVSEQIGVLDVQRDVALRNYERTKRLFEQHAATAQQLDQAEREYKVLIAQIEATRAQHTSVGKEASSSDARIAQIHDLIAKSLVKNPQPGTVLATYAKAGEVVQPGQPLYRIANLDTLTLRAYVTENQLAQVKLGSRVQVRVDRGGGGGSLLTLPGVVSWVASKAEFTPTPVQTRDERADLVYAIKVLVPNPQGALKIGMPADLALTAPTSSTPAAADKSAS
jgi:membrane fusion protein YbhG